MPDSEAVNPDDLLPELRGWNDGHGISIEAWLSDAGNFKLAIAFGELFWPPFVEHDGCVLFAAGSLDSYAGFLASKREKAMASRWRAVMNHRHVLDLFPQAESDATEVQIRHMAEC